MTVLRVHSEKGGEIKAAAVHLLQSSAAESVQNGRLSGKRCFVLRRNIVKLGCIRELGNFICAVMTLVSHQTFFIIY